MSATARVTRRFRLPPQRVFDAWLDPQAVRVWLGAAARREGMGELTEVVVDPRVGGAFRFVYRQAGRELVQAGQYLELSPPRRLVHTWDIALPHVERVVIQISETADGCELVLDHVMDPGWSGETSGVTAAWASVLGAIDAALS
jgi:uncharacterized protein YndB with AHSA1/START domain